MKWNYPFKLVEPVILAWFQYLTEESFVSITLLSLSHSNKKSTSSKQINGRTVVQTYKLLKLGTYEFNWNSKLKPHSTNEHNEQTKMGCSTLIIIRHDQAYIETKKSKTQLNSTFPLGLSLHVDGYTQKTL